MFSVVYTDATTLIAKYNSDIFDLSSEVRTQHTHRYPNIHSSLEYKIIPKLYHFNIF